MIRQVLKCFSTPLRYKLSLYQTRFLIFFQTSHWVGAQGDEHVKFCRKTLLLLHIWIVMSRFATTYMSNIFFHFLLSSRPLRSNANPDFCYSAADSIMLITYQCFKFESNKVVYTFQIFHKMIAVLTLFFKLSSLKNPYIYSSCIHLASTHDYYCSCLSQRSSCSS